MRAERVPWLMAAPDGTVRRVILDTETGRTTLDHHAQSGQFDEAARTARNQTALLYVALLNVADTGALRAVRVHG